MSDKENKTPSPDDGKLHIDKSIFQTSKESKEKAAEEERLRQEAMEQKLAERRKKAAEARDKRLEEERRELIRLKQGIIEESETIREEEPVEVKQGFFKSIASFFYLNKWWMGIGTVFVIVAVVLIMDLINKPRPDMEILMIGENYMLGQESGAEDYFAQFAGDYNGNGEVFAAISYIPYTGDEQKDYASSATQRLTMELQSDQSVILIGNAKAAELLNSEGFFTDLTTLFPDDPHIKGDRFMLAGTGFAEKVGLTEEQLGDDWFIAIRNPKKLAFTNKDDMEKLYNRDLEVFTAVIRDLSE